ncbi:MAG: hypothetical protein BroJett011_74570 [Chloroflexota bacterium]|nr:MAG: hypothetical protein BroJett011_74570 [Chloroflexota bacterium]
MQHQNFKWVIPPFILVLVVVLFGCGGQSESQSVTSAATFTPIPPPTAAPAEPEPTATPAPTATAAPTAAAVEPTAEQKAESSRVESPSGELDMRTLPRFADAEVIYEDKATTIYVTPAEVAAVADFSRRELGALGWQEYKPPFSQQGDYPDLETLTFKKDGQGLSVFISVAPAQDNKTSVQYAPIPLQADLPALADASNIEFSDSQLYLGYTTPSDFDTVIAFYREQLAAPEWQEVAERSVVAQEMTRLFFAGKEMALWLELTPAGDGLTKVVLQPMSSEEIAALGNSETPPAEATQEGEPTGTEEAVPAETGGSGLEQLPLPGDAQEVVYDTDFQEITFNSPSNINKLVEFFRQALPAQGWTEDETIALVSPNLAALEFTQGDASLSLTIMNLGAGQETDVILSVSGEMAAAPGGTDSAGGETDENLPPVDAGELVAEDKDGLPVPDNYENFSDENSPYRRSLYVTSPSPVKALFEFYNRELADRGWLALPSTVGATDDQATQLYENPDGQLDLRLTKNSSGGTDINLTIKMIAAAKKDGILPPSGQARIYFGNFTDGQIVFNINQKEIKVEVQDPGQTSMEGVPFVDVPPGEHAFTLTLPGETPLSDKITVGQDETWALAGGPGGALPLQMY